MPTTKFTAEQIAFADRLQQDASMALADWARRSFDAGHSLDEVKSALRRAMAVVEAERT